MKYLLLGKERFLKQEFIQDLRKKCFPSGDSGFNFINFTAKKDSLGAFFDFCRTAPFLSQKRMAVFWDADKLSAADKERFLTEWNGAFPTSAEIVICSDESNARRDSLLQGISEKTKPLTFHVPFDRDIPGWIAASAKKREKILDRTAAHLLVDRIGKDLALVDAAIEQLSIYVSPKTAITAADVEALLGKSAEQDVFALMDYLMDRNTAAALSQLRRLMGEGVRGPEILAVLALQADKLKKGLVLLKEGVPAERIGGELRIHSFFLDKFMKQLRGLSPEKILHLSRKMLDADQAIKTGRRDEASALESLVISEAS